MLVTLKIQRFDPERTPSSWWSVFRLEAEPSDRVLDLLIRVKDEMDGTLTFRRSCAHGICGSCAMRVNGANRLACKTLVRDQGRNITVEPLLGLQVEKDLVVDMEPFFAAYRKVKPYLINDEPLPADGRERRQSPAERMRIDDTTKCILCGACTTACPVFWADGEYIGPAAFVAAHRFLFDSRDRGAAEHTAALQGVDGIWRCRTIFQCTVACPREIKVTKAIAEVKGKLVREAVR
ncbi:MAG: succinate dehydrogenase iron-sulfur subunit [Anaerolineales bacterium]|nr:succinate dehydrogenase iron-sulfur subunit [Anaerolineales bacterium]